MGQSGKLWWKKFRASKRGKAYKLFWHYLHQARIRKDAELEKALVEARQQVDHASKVDSLAIVRKLKRFKWKERVRGKSIRVAAKVKTAGQLDCDPRTLMTPEEIAYYDLRIKSERERRDNGLACQQSKTWRRKNRKQYLQSRQYDNARQGAKRTGNIRLATALHQERMRLGRADRVDVLAIKERFKK